MDRQPKSIEDVDTLKNTPSLHTGSTAAVQWKMADCGYIKQ